MQVRLCGLLVAAAAVMAAGVSAAAPPARERYKLEVAGKVDSVAISRDGGVVAAVVRGESVEATMVVAWRLTAEGPSQLHGAFEQPARAVALSPDGRVLATSHRGGRVRLWTLADGRETASLELGHGPLAFSPSGTYLVVVGSLDARIWDLKNGRLKAVLAGHVLGPDAVAFSPRGGLVATGGNDGTVRLWDLSGRQRTVLTAFTHYADAVSISADETRVAAAGSEAEAPVFVWDVASGRREHALRRPSGANGLAFSPSGELAIGWLDGGITIEDLRRTDPPPRLEGHSGPVSAIALTPDGRTLVSGSWDGTVRVWTLPAAAGPPPAVRPPADTAPPWPPPVRVGRGLREPRLIRNTSPSYPESARKAGIEGVVILEITIAPEGHVAAATVLRGVHPEIDQAAVDAVKDWLYEPSTVRGVAVPVLMTVTVNFRMK